MKKSTHSRPPMKQKQHPAHNMPSEEHDGTPLGTNAMEQPDASQMPLQEAMMAQAMRDDND